MVMRELAANDILTFTPPISDLLVDCATIERDFGYRKSNAPEPIREVIDEVLPLVPARVEPRCGFRVLPADSVIVNADSFSSEGVEFLTGPIIAKQLRKSSSVAIYVSTVGPAMERWASQLMAEGDMMRGYVVDAIASEIVEQASEWLEKKISAFVKQRGWSVTNRYSPGYCDWPVADQHKLFSLLPPGFCGVTLTSSALMLPIKSISGIIGVGADVTRGAYQCSICELKDCFRRREDPEHVGEEA